MSPKAVNRIRHSASPARWSALIALRISAGSDGLATPLLANLLLMSSPSFGGFSGVETAGESIRSHTGGVLLSGHAFQKIESPGSGWAVPRESQPARGGRKLLSHTRCRGFSRKVDVGRPRGRHSASRSG